MNDIPNYKLFSEVFLIYHFETEEKRSFIIFFIRSLIFIFQSKVFSYDFVTQITSETRTLSRPAYFKSDGPMMEIEMWRPWRQCISPKCLISHLYPNGPSTECPRSVTTVTYAYRVVGILRDDKQRRNRCHQKVKL